MTHTIVLISAIFFALPAVAAEAMSSGEGVLAPDIGLRLLTPRDEAPVLLPPLSDAYRCEPVIRIDEGTPVSLTTPADGQGAERRLIERLCTEEDL